MMAGAGVVTIIASLIANFLGFEWLVPSIPATVTLAQPGAQTPLVFSSTVYGLGRSSIAQTPGTGLQTAPLGANGYLHAGNPFSSGQFTAQNPQAFPPGRQNLNAVCAGDALLHAFDTNAQDPVNGSSALLTANLASGPVSGFVPNHYVVLGTDTTQLNNGKGTCISGTYIMGQIGPAVSYAKAACSVPENLSSFGPVKAMNFDLWEDPNPAAGAGGLKIAFVTPQGDAAVAEAGADRTFGTADDTVDYFQSNLSFPYPTKSIAVSKYYVVVLNRNATTQPALYYRYAGADGAFGTADDSGTMSLTTSSLPPMPGVRTDVHIDKSAANASWGSRITWVERDTQSSPGNQLPSSLRFADLAPPAQLLGFWIPQIGTVQGNNPLLGNHGIAADAIIYSILSNPPYPPTLFRRSPGTDGLWGTNDDVTQTLLTAPSDDFSIEAEVLDQTVFALVRNDHFGTPGPFSLVPNQLSVIDLASGAVAPVPPNPQFLSNPLHIGLAAAGAALTWYENESVPLGTPAIPPLESRDSQIYTFSRTTGIGSQLTNLPFSFGGQIGSWGKKLLYSSPAPGSGLQYLWMSEMCD